tara:strand:+ start:1820 stop:2491 length:672 start_codon:yes stop_codon:yes gene_type:complete
MYKSEETGEIFKALGHAFKELGPALKTGRNPHFKSKFAGLEATDSASRTILGDHDIFVTQGVEEGLGGLALATYLVHGASGQMIGQCVPFIVPKGRMDDPQAFGSALTYARRYGLQAALGMVTADDDGETAATIAREQAKRTETSSKTRATERLMRAVGDAGIEPKDLDDYILKKRGVNIKDLESQKVAGLADWITQDGNSAKKAINDALYESPATGKGKQKK